MGELADQTLCLRAEPRQFKDFVHLSADRDGFLARNPGPQAIARGNLGRQLSGGEQEMLSVSRALLLNPRLLILDEPSQGLAPLVVKEVFRIVEQMRAEGISVLLVEQNVRMSLDIADYAYVLDNGGIVFEGPARELAQDEARVRSLAGASAEEWTIDKAALT